MGVDPADVQGRMNDAIQELLRAIDRYETEGRSDGNFIVMNYLRKFQDGNAERADAAVDIAKQTEDEINNFRSREGTLLSRVAIARLHGEYAPLAAIVGDMGDMLADFSAGLDDTSDRLLRTNTRAPKPARLDLQVRLDLRRRETAQVGESVVNVINLASKVYDFRCDTLSGFRNNNLQVNRDELIRRVRSLLITVPAEEAFSRFRELVQELLAEQLKKIPILGWVIWVADKVKMLAKPKAGTAYGDTDIMLKLLPSLRKDQEMLTELDRIFQDLAMNGSGERSPTARNAFSFAVPPT